MGKYHNVRVCMHIYTATYVYAFYDKANMHLVILFSVNVLFCSVTKSESYTYYKQSKHNGDSFVATYI